MKFPNPFETWRKLSQAKTDVSNLGHSTPELDEVLRVNKRAVNLWLAGGGLALTGGVLGAGKLFLYAEEAAARNKAQVKKNELDTYLSDFPEEERWRLARGSNEFVLMNGALIESMVKHAMLFRILGTKPSKVSNYYFLLNNIFCRRGKARIAIDPSTVDKVRGFFKETEVDPLAERERFDLESGFINIDLLEFERVRREKSYSPDDEWFLATDMPMYRRDSNTLYLPSSASAPFVDYIDNIVGPYALLALSDAHAAVSTKTPEQYEQARHQRRELLTEVFTPLAASKAFYGYAATKKFVDDFPLDKYQAGELKSSEQLAQDILREARKRVVTLFEKEHPHKLDDDVLQENFLRQEEQRLAYLIVRLVLQSLYDEGVGPLRTFLLEIVEHPALLKRPIAR